MKILKYASVIPIFLISLLALYQNFSPTISKVENLGEKHKNQTISIIKHFEGFQPLPYKDNDGTMKIGYGFPADGKTSITKEEAGEILEMKVEKIALEIKKEADKHNLFLETFHIYALASLSYNIGQAKVDIILADMNLISGEEILKYYKAKVNGEWVEYRGLKLRRIEECKLFTDGGKCEII